jgi:Xaa-Pro aminopeptidase
MGSHFTEEFFKGNRQRLRQLFAGTAPIVITANGLLQRSRDTTFTFRQDSNFWYLTGLNEPDLILVLDKDKEYLIVPPRDETQNTFDGALNLEDLKKQSGIKTILNDKTGWRQLSPRIKRVKHVATLAAPPPYVKRHGFYVNPARAALTAQLREINPELEFLDLRTQFVKMRSIKQDAELAALQAAINTTVVGFKTIKRRLNKYKNEAEIAAELGRVFQSKGSNGHAYSPIVAGGANACTIHYALNNSPLQPNRLLLIDAAAEVENYAADITRTYALKPPTKRQRAVFEAVLEAQQFALSLLKPGKLLHEYEQQVEAFMGEKLRELGLIKSISHETVRAYYPHGTSHFLGLDVHDEGDYKHPLEKGMVLTVEPGIYIPKEGIGIRLEDDVLITAKGAKVLSKRLPRSLW